MKLLDTFISINMKINVKYVMGNFLAYALFKWNIICKILSIIFKIQHLESYFL